MLLYLFFLDGTTEQQEIYVNATASFFGGDSLDVDRVGLVVQAVVDGLEREFRMLKVSQSLFVLFLPVEKSRLQLHRK